MFLFLEGYCYDGSLKRVKVDGDNQDYEFLGLVNMYQIKVIEVFDSDVVMIHLNDDAFLSKGFDSLELATEEVKRLGDLIGSVNSRSSKKPLMSDLMGGEY